VIRSAVGASLIAFLLGLISMVGFLMIWLVPRGIAGALMLMGSLPGVVLSFVALTLSTYTLPERFLLRRSIMFLSLGLNCFPWVFLIGALMIFGLR